jgi:hypothetical protein
MDILLRLLPVIITGLLLNRTLIRTADDEMIFDNVIIGFFVILFVLALVWTFFKDKNAHKRTQLKSSFIPTTTGILFIVSFFITNTVLAARDNSPILIQAGYNGGYNGAWFEFRKDGTYKFGNSSGIGATYFRGKYNLNDSLITLDRENIDNVVQSRILAIRNTSTFGTIEKIIYQINPQHEVIDKEFKFTVHIDNHK